MDNLELSQILGQLKEREEGAKIRAKMFETRFDGIDRRMAEDRETTRDEIKQVRNRIWGLMAIAFTGVVGLAGLWIQILS